MTTMNRNFWDKNAGRYDAFLARDAAAYERMVHLMHHAVQDMFNLPYADKSFDVVIVSNALHIVPEPEKALREIRRVLRDDGVLIAPTFTHLGNGLFGKIRAFFLKLAGSALSPLVYGKLPSVSSAKRLAHPQEPGAAGQLSADLRRMHQGMRRGFRSIVKRRCFGGGDWLIPA